MANSNFEKNWSNSCPKNLSVSKVLQNIKRVFKIKLSELDENLSNGSVQWCWVAGDRQGRTLKDGLGF